MMKVSTATLTASRRELSGAAEKSGDLSADRDLVCRQRLLSFGIGAMHYCVAGLAQLGRRSEPNQQ
jgi:hypothetical protein